jgi:hypothetical protein
VSTARDVCRRALVRIRVYSPDQEPSAADMADALAQLNDMMFGWKQMGVDVGHEEMTLDSTFGFFVPPLEAVADTISALSFRGGWDANANSPALATNTGTDGYAYKVTTAGSTVLNDVTSWSVGDYALFCGAPTGGTWLKGRSSRPFEGIVIAMLAFQLASDHGKDPPAVIVREANGWRHIKACFVKPKMNDTIDTALVHMPSRRFIPDGTLLGD